MSTISKMETSTGQEETAILLEEYEKRIATLQESLKQAGRIHPNEAVIMQEIKRVVDERDDLKRRLGNAELLLERLKEDNKQFKFDLDLYNTADAKALALWRENHPDTSKCFVPGLGKMLVWLMDEVDRANGKYEGLYQHYKLGDDLYLAENLRAEKLQDALLQIRHLTWKNPFLYGRKRLRELLANVFSIAYNALKVKDPIDNTTTLRTAEESSGVDTTAKQPEGTTKLDKALQNIDVTKRVLAENSCPSEFGLEDCEFNPETGCTLSCEDCWNEEVEE